MALSFELLRPDDLLNLRIDTVNLRIEEDAGGAPHLGIENPSQPAYLIVGFPPQAIAESAYFEHSIVQPEGDPNRPDPDASKTESEPPTLPPPGTARARMSGRTRLVFRVPTGHRIPITTAGLLDWAALTLEVHPGAAIGRNPTQQQIQTAPNIRAPTPTETSIELPFRLIISPTADVGWDHRGTPHSHRGRTAVWHTRMRLGGGTGNGSAELSAINTAPMRAVWSPDFKWGGYEDPDAPDPYLGRTAMSADDRTQIVVLTSAFRGFEVEQTPIQPIVQGQMPIGLGSLEVSAAVDAGGANASASLAIPQHLAGFWEWGGPIIGRWSPVPYVPKPFEVEALILSPLGGWLRSRGSWTPPSSARPRPIPIPWNFPAIFRIPERVPNPPPGGPAGPPGGVPANPPPHGGPPFTPPGRSSDPVTPPANPFGRSSAPSGPPAAPPDRARGVRDRAAEISASAYGGIVPDAGPVIPASESGLVEVAASGRGAVELATADAAGVHSFAVPGMFTLEDWHLDLSEWVHQAAQGRDHYVRIVYEGELWPFRHKAALIKVTERKFKRAGNLIVAYLMQRMFIVVREPVRQFPASHRGSPFRKVRLTTLVTPDIAVPQNIVGGGIQRSFWVEVMAGANRRRFQFHGVGTDADGQEVDFTIPLIFVSRRDHPHASRREAVAKAYNQEHADVYARLNGATVGFAPRDAAAKNENARLPTTQLHFVVDPAGNPPRMLKALVRVPQVEEVTGGTAASTIRYFEDYVKNGIDGGSGVFAEIAQQTGPFDPLDPFKSIGTNTLGVAFSSDQAGGFATPDLSVSTLTRALGPLAGKAADAVSGAFDPTSFFQKGVATLFGSFDLADLLPVGTLGKNAPKLRTKVEDLPGGVKAMVASLEWEPEVKSELKLPTASAPIAEFRKKGDTKLVVRGRFEKPITPVPGGNGATFRMSGKLNDFEVGILQCVYLNFKEFSFTAGSGTKTNVKVALDTAKPIEFKNDLKFVEELRKAIPPDLFGDGPSLDITATHIRAGFAIGLPPLAVGVFALRDVSLGAALTLPFTDGKPVFDFNVSERANPFLLSVGIFGGGGFFRLEIDTAGVKMLEAALEFGATASLDIGVASGSVHMMAGIYFALERKEVGGELTAVLSGYLRLGGSLRVLGLIRVTVEFNLSFTYIAHKEKAYGRATLMVCVEVAFFSKTVELTVERAFGGTSSDPTFGQLMNTADAWEDYALAFA